MSEMLNQAGMVVNLYKKMGETPRERLERLRGQRPYYEHEVLSYAGRLDPMAEGVMLCLVGSANRRREQYLDMSKEYVLDVLFGFSTDTYDVLGRVLETGDASSVTRKRVTKAINEFRGQVSQEYPPYSSKTVEGKSLFEWARSGAIASLVLPTRTVTIYEIELTAMYKVSEQTLFNYIEANVGKVNGDFRQEEIMRLWKQHLPSNSMKNKNALDGLQEGSRSFPCATIKIACSSGTYARAIANGIGQELGVPALALHILRTKVGEFDIEKALR